eukprot:Gb_05701 [translate_table: standard]
MENHREEAWVMAIGVVISYLRQLCMWLLWNCTLVVILSALWRDRCQVTDEGIAQRVPNIIFFCHLTHDKVFTSESLGQRPYKMYGQGTGYIVTGFAGLNPSLSNLWVVQLPSFSVLENAVSFDLMHASSQLHSFHTLQSEKPILQKPLVECINRHPNAGWKASMSPRFSNYTVGEFTHLLGVLPTPQKLLESVPIKVYPKGLKLPKQFDAREAWPHCTSARTILDQGHCGSCWAFAAVEALSDRFCIHFKVNATLSENDLVACCGFWCGSGCNGGYPLSAWRYFKRKGVVTDECDPYFDDNGCEHPGCEPLYPTPRCVKQCKNDKSWSHSKHYSATAYRINSDLYNIMAEVFTNGPVEVSFSVFEHKFLEHLDILESRHVISQWVPSVNISCPFYFPFQKVYFSLSSVASSLVKECSFCSLLNITTFHYGVLGHIISLGDFGKFWKPVPAKPNERDIGFMCVEVEFGRKKCLTKTLVAIVSQYIRECPTHEAAVDFAHYETGVYKHILGNYIGGHAVKLIGWGTTDGVDYWLLANSWNTAWGEGGYFKIVRGANECGIEAEPVAGMPSPKNMILDPVDHADILRSW